MQTLVKRYVVCENVAGSDLKREQLVFFWNQLDFIYKTPLKKLMIEDDPDLLKKTIPKFVSFRNLQRRVKLVAQITHELGSPGAYKEE